MYAKGDYRRQVMVNDTQGTDYRPPFMRDYGRIIHSASFRRQQGKTQVFPGHESDFFRNRLTHSLEVAQIAEGIADRINHMHRSDMGDHKIDGRLCAAAGLVHDIGHPPFGHNGERALDAAMRQYGGFEGNAQTLRILSRLEKKVRYSKPVAGDDRAGMNLCLRTLASILKYDNEIAQKRPKEDKVKKGYYRSERPIVNEIKKRVLRNSPLPADTTFKTIECSIMDLADDFAYSVYDLEDSLKAGFLTPAGILASSSRLLQKVAAAVTKQLERECSAAQVSAVFAQVFEGIVSYGEQVPTHADAVLTFAKAYESSQQLSEDSYYRTRLSSALVHEFIGGVKFELNTEHPALSKAYIDGDLEMKVEVLKQYTYVAMIYSARVKLGEYRGFQLVTDIFEALMGDKGDLLMPEDVRQRFLATPEKNKAKRARTVCDYVAGMTDRYAMEFWARLKSDAAESMFKPI
ncbi:deoxyguanosinetriphosphate triphosphohydrolase [Mesorhizobium helmanticense]|uniref:Deoxyguanosinetriphosphate triphosphohydrolase-like protein n=2 Tax=Mesorhizobium helmanticense TaxID=1776423 RepID=A0A2T4ILD6_9HYPH|nr:deoxyguanosinetriphosphate triphosphohydrolase [Mesorhizobium helmanticense]